LSQVLYFTTGFTIDTTGPVLAQTNPFDGDVDVPLNTRIVLQFSDPLDRTTGEAGLGVTIGGARVLGTYTFEDGGRRVTFQPAQPLLQATVYTVSYTAALKNLSGEPLENPGSFSFTTGTGVDAGAPFVSLVIPSQSSTGVGRNVRPRVVFSEPINPITVTRDSVRLVDATTGQIIVAVVALAADRQTVTLTPAMPLAPHTPYSLFIAWYAGVLDVAGNGSFGAITSFTTGGGFDDTSPTVEAVSPVDGAVGVAVNAQIIARLSEPLDPSSVSATAITLDPPVTGSVALAADGMTVTFTAVPSLALATSYSVRISGVRDLVGNVLTPVSSTFTTAADATPDLTAPRLLTMDPAHGASGVPVTTAITLTFSEPLAVTTVDLNSVAMYANLPDIGWVLLAATYQVDASGTVLRVIPATPLPGGVLIQLNVSYHAVITDLAGNGMGASFPQFTTAAAIDTAPPTVVAVTPNDGTTEVGPNATVVLTFSESLNPASVNDQTIALFGGATRLGAGIGRSADNRTVMLSAALPFDTSMTVVVTSGVRDLAGNVLADFTSTFTTRAAADPEKPGTPSIVTQRPGNGATGVPATSRITLIANEPLNPATVPGALNISQNGVLITGAIAVTGQGQAIHFTPDAAFMPGALIQIFLASTAQDVAGNALFSYSGQFTVEPDTTGTAPVLLRASPVYGATFVPRNPVIEFEFNEPLDPTTVSAATVSLYDYTAGTVVPGTLTLRSDGRVIRLVPSPPLRADSPYFTAIRAGLRDLQGSAYPQIHDFYFTTGSAVDDDAPVVKAVGPPAGAAEVGVNALIRVRFTEPVNAITVSAVSIRLSAGDRTLMPASISFTDAANTQVTVTPLEPLPDSALVTITIEGVEDLAGNAVTPRTTTFTTHSRADVDPPQLLRTSVVHGQADVPVNSVFTLEFNEPVDPPTVLDPPQIVLHDHVVGQRAATLEVSPDGRTVTLTPAGPLAVGRPHSLSVCAVQDLAGNSYFYCAFGFVFTTAFAVDTTAPEVMATNPADGTTGAPPNAQVQVRFNEPVQATSLDGVQLLSGGSSVPVTFALSDGNRTVTLTPATLLAANTVHVISIAGVSDASGNTLANMVSSTFTTTAGFDGRAPFVSVVNPPHTATGVGRNVRPRVVFSEPINPITVTRDSVRLVDATTGQIVVAAVALAADRQTVTLTPAMPLAPHTTYSLAIGWYAGVVDIAGNGSFGVITSFTTGGGVDDTPPTMEAVSPVDGAVGVAVNAQIIARLSEPLDPSSVSATTISLDPPVTGNVALAADGVTITFTPPAPYLAPATMYSVRVSGVRDLVGNVLTPVSSTFTTAADATPDRTPPTLIAIDPPHGTTGVSVTTPITLTFSEPVAVTTVDLNSVAVYANLPDIGWVLLAATYRADASGTGLTVTPATPLPGGVTVQLNVSYHATITDLAGNGMGASFPQFTTAAAIDTTPPTVVAVTPNDGTTEVGPNATVVLTFSESPNPLTVSDQTIALFAGATRLGTGIARSADNRTVMLSAALPFDTPITVAVTSGVRDLAGNALADFSSRFRTRAAADPEKPGTPSIITQRPGNGATGVPATSSITLFANEPLNPATVPGALYLSQNGVLITGAIAVTGQGQAIHFTPDAPFVRGALVQIFLASTAQDVAGNALFSYSGQFTVEPDTTTTAPVLLRASPAYGATLVPRNPVIEFEFNEPLDPITVSDAAVFLYDYANGTVVPGTLALRNGGRVIRLVPTGLLRAEATYLTAIRAGLRDLQGSAYPHIHDFYFTTGPSEDTTGPVVKAVGPPAGATDVGVNALIRVRFTEPVNAITVSAASIRLSAGDRTLMPASISFTDAANTQVTVTPLEPLPDSAIVTITIDGVEDLAGHAVTPHTATFTTRSRADVDPPQVLRASVVNGQSDVPVNSVFALEFTEPLDPPTVLDPPAIVLYDHVTGRYVNATLEVSPDGRTVTLTPAGPLSVGRLHTLSVCVVQDLAGNSYFYCAFSVSFTTAFAIDTTAPEVMVTNPVDGMTAVPRNAQLQIRFSEPVQPTSLNGVQVLVAGSPVTVIRTLSDANRTLTMTPATLLAPNTAHVITVSGVADTSGNLLASTIISSFDTAGGFDSIAPRVTLVNPPHGATGVGRNVRPRVVFSEPINLITVTGDGVRLVDGTTGQIVLAAVAVAADRQTVTLTPAMPLAPHTVYTLFISWYAGVLDIAGNGSFGAITSFTTGGGLDNTAPTVEAVSPVDGASGVPVNARVVARLSEPLDPSSVNSTAITLDPPATGSVALAADGMTVTFTPAAPYLAPATTYLVRVSGLRDLVETVATPVSSSFTTAADVTPDITAPTLIATDPPHGATGVPVTTAITLTFSEPVIAATLDLNSVAVYANLPDIGWVLLAATYQVNASGTVLTVTPTTPLPGGVLIQLNVSYHATITDLAGNGMGASFPQFTTAAAIDTTPPTVLAVVPADGTTDLGPNATVALTFSEPLNPATINDSTIALFAGAMRLPGFPARSADNRTVTLSTTLPLGALITVVATSGVRDLAGNALTDFSSTFRTRAAADPEKPGSPSIITQRPGNGATGVPATSSITLFANEPLSPATIPGALYVLQNGVLITGAVAVTGQGQAIHFTPDAAFMPGALVQIFLASTAQDAAGNALFGYSGQFTVEPDPTTTAPVLLRASPVYGATFVPRNPVIEFEFNEPLDPTTVSDATVVLYDYTAGIIVPGTLTLRNDRVIRLVPTAPLRPEATYFTAIRAGLRDLQGSAYPHIHDFYFTTRAAVDELAPVVKAIGPPPGATEVGVNALIRVRFTEPVNPLTVSGATLRVSSGGRDLVPASISFTDAANTQVTLTPLAPLPDSTLVTITIAGVEDLAGNAATSHTTTFTTQSRADVDPPQLLRASVSYGQSDVPVNSVFTLEFTEPIDPQTVLDPPAIVLYDHVAGQYVNALLEVAPDGRTVILTPAGALGVGRAHTLSICAVQDLAGNGYFYCAFSVFFTTAFAADAIPPQVVVTNPGSDMTAPRNAQIQIRFDEPVQPTSLGGIQLLTGGSPLPFTSAVSDGNRTVTLTPSTLLSANTPHLMTVDGVRDAAGNEMGAGVMTTFTTGSGADFVGPSPTAFVPVDGAMDVPTNTSVAVTFDETINPLSAFVSGSVTLRLTNTGEIVVAGVSFSPDFRTVILTPSSPLAPATRYTVTTGFELTDQAGNRPRFGMSSTFTTQ
jgi:spore maturation protein SpmB